MQNNATHVVKRLLYCT